MADKNTKEAPLAPSMEPVPVPETRERTGKPPAVLTQDETIAQLATQFVASGMSQEDAAARAQAMISGPPTKSERPLLCAEFVRGAPGALADSFRRHDESIHGVRRLTRTAWDKAYNDFLSTERS